MTDPKPRRRKSFTEQYAEAVEEVRLAEKDKARAAKRYDNAMERVARLKAEAATIIGDAP